MTHRHPRSRYPAYHRRMRERRGGGDLLPLLALALAVLSALRIIIGLFPILSN